MGESSYVIGSSHSIRSLTEKEKALLDSAPWVFVCNSFLSHWEEAGFRPTFWCYGDNHEMQQVLNMEIELSAAENDWLLMERLKYMFVALEQEPRLAELAIRRHPLLPIKTYKRGPGWHRETGVGGTLGDEIYHYGSTLTDLVNFAWILNPEQPIKIIGNEYMSGWGHFYQRPADVIQPQADALTLWRRVQEAMWLGLGDLYQKGLPIVDCNPRHGAELPGRVELPRGSLLV